MGSVDIFAPRSEPAKSLYAAIVTERDDVTVPYDVRASLQCQAVFDAA